MTKKEREKGEGGGERIIQTPISSMKINPSDKIKSTR